MLKLSNEAGRAAWIQSTYITHDTEILAAEANQKYTEAGVELAKQAARFDGLNLPPELDRKMKLLKLGLTLPAPSDPAESEELSKLAAKLESIYGKGEYCRDAGKKESCLDVGTIGRIMANSRNPAELLDVWQGWRTISPPMRPDFARLVELTNKGAREPIRVADGWERSHRREARARCALTCCSEIRRDRPEKSKCISSTR